MTIIAVQSLKKDFGIKEILKNATFSIEDQDKIGLIGVNGTGKSTLLKILAGLELSDGGEINVKSGARIIYLPQRENINRELTVLEQVFANCSSQMQLIKDYEDLSHRLSHTNSVKDSQLIEKFNKITEKIESDGLWELETNAKIILQKLGIEDFEAKVGELSGGYCKRIALASALIAEPDLLLMDEPTNHLDAESVEWLQEYLSKFKGSILLITHDRYFLDRVTNRILEIDQGDLYSYNGNYSYFLEKKALAQESLASSQQKHQGILRRELEWLKKGPKARSTKQKARIGRVYQLQEKTFKEASAQVEIDTPSRRLGKKVIECHGVSKSFSQCPLIENFTYEFVPSDRIGIIGGNGTGKSTLMNIISGKIPPDRGSVAIGSTVKIGYFDQHSEDIGDDTEAQKRVIDYIKDVAAIVETGDGTKITASQMLERFLFTPNQQYTPLFKLSGGEKRRLFLLKILMEAPNVLLLDEPTNDLDVQTLAVLEEYLEVFNGCVIIVSHDRYFLDRTVKTIFAIEKGGKIRQYPGNYSLYLDYKKQEQSEKQEVKIRKQKEGKNEKVKDNSSPQRPRRLSNYQKKELEKLESVIIPNLEKKKAEIEEQLYHHPPTDYNELQLLTSTLAQVIEEVDQATQKWLELCELEG